MKRFFTKWPAALIVLVLAGCGKNNQPVPMPVEPLAGKISRIDHDAWNSDSIFYNNNGQVVRIKTFSKHPQSIPQIFDIEYNPNKTVKQVLQDNGQKYVYQYMGGLRPVTVSHYNPTGIKLDYVIYDYDANGRLVLAETVESQGPAGQVDTYVSQRSYHYRPDGNLEREEVFMWNGQQYNPDFVVTYDNYDQNKNADSISNYLYLGFYSFMKNNPGKRTVTFNGVSTQHNYTYQFNTSFMPVEKKHTYTSQGQPYEEITKYFYY
ncbi:hypothetical protein [Sediminibacterium ginsengisoli]|uniref:YD repeat-containing protein n=1 Tax=Sediminibacterium ginsengisoli TaxID=413434 RepID=A0A1T4R3J6_9BACT|nr:hypothetical protein [Sediminibacterium ginsengisoli]SKA10251.1 hypothetical protein SAMN04488132_11092 [Sediminibacterium ginsengisoli]